MGSFGAISTGATSISRRRGVTAPSERTWVRLRPMNRLSAPALALISLPFYAYSVRESLRKQHTVSKSHRPPGPPSVTPLPFRHTPSLHSLRQSTFRVPRLLPGSIAEGRMTVSEQALDELRTRLERVLGPEEAATLMDHLPPERAATKADLEALERTSDDRFGAVD